MESHVNRFSGRVAEYERFRERYDPEVLLPRLRSWCGLEAGWIVADVGAGTGMLSDVFLGNGNRVLALEPNPEMRFACAQLHAGEARLTVHNGTAENTGLEAASVDMVSVGRATHWFDRPRALEEFRRILRPGGWIAIAGLGRRTDARAENQALEALLREFSSDGKPTHLTYQVYEELDAAFVGGRFRKQEIPHEVHLPWHQLRGLTLSLSHAPLQGAPEFPAFEERLHALFGQFEQDGLFTLATRYWLAVGQFGMA